MSEAKRVWRYQLDADYTRAVPALASVEFASRWLQIKDGQITVKESYAWDGASPVWFLPFVGWWGVPMGAVQSDGLPAAYWATLVHDALCQFRTQLFVDKEAAVQLLYQMLLEHGMPRWQARLYAFMVRHFGPQNWLGFKPVELTQMPPSWTL